MMWSRKQYAQSERGADSREQMVRLPMKILVVGFVVGLVGLGGWTVKGLGDKADRGDTTAALARKADKEQVEAALRKKVDVETLEAAIGRLEVAATKVEASVTAMRRDMKELIELHPRTNVNRNRGGTP